MFSPNILYYINLHIFKAAIRIPQMQLMYIKLPAPERSYSSINCYICISKGHPDSTSDALSTQLISMGCTVLQREHRVSHTNHLCKLEVI